MTKEEIQKRLQANPFTPFKVKIAGGAEVIVPSRDHAHLHPTGRVMIVFLDQGGTEIIDVALVSSLEIKEAA